MVKLSNYKVCVTQTTPYQSAITVAALQSVYVCCSPSTFSIGFLICKDKILFIVIQNCDIAVFSHSPLLDFTQLSSKLGNAMPQ